MFAIKCLLPSLLSLELSLVSWTYQKTILLSFFPSCLPYFLKRFKLFNLNIGIQVFKVQIGFLGCLLLDKFLLKTGTMLHVSSVLSAPLVLFLHPKMLVHLQTQGTGCSMY